MFIQTTKLFPHKHPQNEMKYYIPEQAYGVQRDMIVTEEMMQIKDEGEFRKLLSNTLQKLGESIMVVWKELHDNK